MDKLSLCDVEVRGLRIMVRADFNVPLTAGPTDTFVVADDTRIRAALPTIQALTSAGAKVILLSHLGRPKGTPEPRYSLAPVAAHLGMLLKSGARFFPENTGPAVEAEIRGMQGGDVLLLENTRFHAGETKNDPELARQWAALADVFVNDAFGTAHRAHASNVGIACCMSRSVAGLLLARELEYLIGALANPASPFVAILGGAKVSDKIGVIQNLEDRVDSILIGGAMSYTFLKALGLPVGASLVQNDWLDFALETYNRGKIVLPTDHVTAGRFGPESNAEYTGVSIAARQLGLDIGPDTRNLYRQHILKAKTVIWNGPMGVFENPAFAAGTVAVAEALADATDSGSTTIVGGGDSVAAVHQANCADRVTHVSTGGGAMLACLEGKELPGLSALTDRPA